MTTGEKIKRKRLERGYTQVKLAKMLNVSQSAITQFEHCTGLLRGETYEKIAAALECSIDELTPDFNDISLSLDKEIENAQTVMLINDLSKSPLFPSYLIAFYYLNETGRKKAIEQLDLLCRIPEFLAKHEKR